MSPYFTKVQNVVFYSSQTLPRVASVTTVNQLTKENDNIQRIRYLHTRKLIVLSREVAWKT